MAFKELADLNCDKAYALGGFDKKTKKNNPTSVTGYFIGTREVDSPKSKTGKCSLHIFSTEKGNVGVWGKTDLDRKMKQVPAGCLTQVTFTGRKETKNNPMYCYKVLVDAEDKIDVATVEQGDSVDATEEAAGDEEAYADESEADAEEEAVEYVEEAPPARAKAPARAATAPDAARQAKVQALLNKNRPKTA